MSPLLILALFAPAFIANAAPVVLAVLPVLRSFNQPVWEPVLGRNKTWRGFIGGTVIGLCAALVLYAMSALFPFLMPLYGNLPRAIGAGLLLSSGALLGDMAKSAVKRRCHRPPGAAFPPWDGVDYMIGAIVFLLPLYRPGISGILVLLIAGHVLSLLANLLSYSIGWKSVWY